MRRREFVRVLVSAVFSSRLLRAQRAGNPQLPLPAPVPWTVGLNPQTPLPHPAVAEGIAEALPRFFTPGQMGTLRRLSDVLLPAMDGKPGALEAETPQFLDFLIGSSPDKRRKMYTGGLDWLEMESQREYKLPFARLEAAQAGAVLEPWLRPWMSDHPPVEAHAEFINVAHSEIRAATANSKAWSEAASAEEDSRGEGLYWSPIEPLLHGSGSGCETVQSKALGAPKNGHSIPVYPR